MLNLFYENLVKCADVQQGSYQDHNSRQAPSHNQYKFIAANQGTSSNVNQFSKLIEAANKPNSPKPSDESLTDDKQIL